MLKRARPTPVSTLLTFAVFAAVAFALPARATGVCEACRAEDVEQVGGHVEPDLPLPSPAPRIDPRGTEHKVPLPGGGAASVRVKPGEGVWLGSPGEGKGDVFVNGGRDKAAVGWRLGF